MDEDTADVADGLQPVAHRFTPCRAADDDLTLDQAHLVASDDRHDALDGRVGSKGAAAMFDHPAPGQQLELLGEIAARSLAFSGGHDDRDDVGTVHVARLAQADTPCQCGRFRLRDARFLST